jgi:RNA polymerase sigma-70 factor (ECF subfamily)
MARWSPEPLPCGNAVNEYDVELDDGELVERSRRGDRTAFAALFSRHNAAVYSLAVRLTPERETAREVAQESWIRAWRALGGFRGEAAFGTWMYRITANTAATWRRRSRRHLAADIDEVPETESLDGAVYPEEVAENRDLGRRLARALGTLPPGIRAVVVMKDVHGWSHQEIAEALGISVTAAKVRLHRGHQKLQHRLRGET